MTASAVEIIEKFGIIICDFGFKFVPILMFGTSNAAVPFDTVIPYFLPI